MNGRILPAAFMALIAGCGSVTQAPTLAPRAITSIQAAIHRNLQAEFATWDRNHDDKVARAELPIVSDADFRMLDRDQDGALTFKEGLTADGENRLTENAAKLPSWTEPETSAALGFGWFNRGPAPRSPVGRNPILLVPGYFEPGAMWLSLKATLEERGWTQIYMMEHWPGFADIRSNSAKAGEMVDRIIKETGSERVDVIGHSMGGLILRHWLSRNGGAPRVSHYVSFATPHKGTIMGYFGPGTSGKQMRPGSEFLTDLNTGATMPGSAHHAGLWSHTDEVVIPQPNAAFEGASNTSFPLSEHLQLAWIPAAQNKAIEELSR